VSINTPEELASMRAAGEIVRRMLDAMKEAVRPGVTTAELDEVGGQVMRQHGAQSAPQLVYKFPGMNCISLNDEAVHGIPSERKVQEGDLVKLDVTVEKDGFMADAAITVAVGEVSEESERLIACAERAFTKAMLVARAGFRVSEIGRAVEREVRRNGFSVIRDLGGHGIGRTIHEAPRIPNFADPAANHRCRVRPRGRRQRRLDGAYPGPQTLRSLRAHAGDHKGRADSTDCISAALPKSLFIALVVDGKTKGCLFFRRPAASGQPSMSSR
jgi:methionyl aminopeptidase